MVCSMNLCRITDTDDAGYEPLMRLFMDSFPECERRPRGWFDRLVREEPRFHCMVCGMGDAMLCYWDLACEVDGVRRRPFVYVEYLAVREELRGGGMGSEVMREWLNGVGDVPVVLEVEPPVCALTRRRVRFYENLGFRLMPDYYVQPSYGVVPGLEMKLMVRAAGGQADVPIGEVIEVLHADVYGEVRSKK